MRSLILVLAIGGATGLTAGAAASLAMSGATLGANVATVQRCMSTGPSVIQNLSGSTVVSVTVSGLPSTCGGATIQATINNQTTSASGSNTVPAGGGSVTVTFASAPAATVAEQIDVVITGP